MITWLSMSTCWSITNAHQAIITQTASAYRADSVLMWCMFLSPLNLISLRAWQPQRGSHSGNTSSWCHTLSKRDGVFAHPCFYVACCSEKGVLGEASNYFVSHARHSALWLAVPQQPLDTSYGCHGWMTHRETHKYACSWVWAHTHVNTQRSREMLEVQQLVNTRDPNN